VPAPGRASDDLAPEDWGIATGYWGMDGRWNQPPATTLTAVLSSMRGPRGECDVAGPTVPPEDAPLRVLTRGGPWPELPGGKLFVEGGGSLDLQPGQSPPPDLPLGYHRFEPSTAGPPLTLALCPDRCPAPPQERAWGWSVQLYASRSRESWGIGDFEDLRRLAAWSQGYGSGFVLLNPLHAPSPGPYPGPSPYFPSSRCFLNPLYLRVEEVPAAHQLENLGKLAAQGRALNSDRMIDRNAAWALKSEALEELFKRFERSGRDELFDAFVEEQGPVLDSYTTFCALAERHGLPWQSWPLSLRHPRYPAVAQFRASPEGARRTRYYAWLQWLCDTQLRRASSDLVCDLAVGVDGGGADGWLWQDTFALDMRVGAPPDDFNATGQDWGVPPWDPWRLRAAAYEPYIATLRAAMRHAQGIRLDHVMGLFRLFWVPLGSEARSGTYVRYPWRDMLGLLCLEAHRAGAYVVGEDLGTVEDEARQVLAERGVLSYKLLWFEPERPPAWPHQALAAVTTHDLPTIAGVWSGADRDAQRSCGFSVNEEGFSDLRRRLETWAGCRPGSAATDVVRATYDLLAEARCALVAATLEDALCVEERPNMPGTVEQWPNWCLALPSPLEELEISPLAEAISRRLGDR
jgi:4-alpha-glucanotransferase